VIFPLFSMLSGVPLIGWAKPVPVNVGRLRRHRSDYVLVAAAGPASNLLIAIAASILLALMPVAPIAFGSVEVSAPLQDLFRRALFLNVLLAVFNMLPIPPLDGSRILRIMVGMSNEQYYRLAQLGYIPVLIIWQIPGVQRFILGTTDAVFDLLARWAGFA